MVSWPRTAKRGEIQPRVMLGGLDAKHVLIMVAINLQIDLQCFHNLRGDFEIEGRISRNSSSLLVGKFKLLRSLLVFTLLREPKVEASFTFSAEKHTGL